MRKKRPRNLAFEDYLDWVKENDLEYQPENWVADCWKAKGTTEGISLRRGRPQREWKSVTKSRTMVHLTYMCLHGLKESPFSQDIHAAHECGNVWCVNPYHVRPADASANERDKKNEDGYETMRKLQDQKRRENHKKGLRMPLGLSVKEKAEWI